jgi:hypothetical protein
MTILISEKTVRYARVTLFGIKKRCRKQTKESFTAMAETDTEALKALQEKVKEAQVGYRQIDGYSHAHVQDMIIKDYGSYQLQEANVYCDTKKTYQFYV